MAEEKTEKTEKVEKPAAKPETSDDIKALATKLGWNPDYDGDERNYVGAEDYILRSREIQDTTARTLRSTKRQVGELEKGFEALKTHNEKVYEVNVKNLKKELRELKKQRKEAKEDGDTELVRELDEEIKDIKDTYTCAVWSRV